MAYALARECSPHLPSHSLVPAARNWSKLKNFPASQTRCVMNRPTSVRKTYLIRPKHTFLGGTATRQTPDLRSPMTLAPGSRASWSILNLVYCRCTGCARILHEASTASSFYLFGWVKLGHLLECILAFQI